jgi:hypothetical protein
MVRDDIEACLQAYRFAELLLSDFGAKPDKEKAHALAAARQLRDEVAARYERAAAAPRAPEERIGALNASRARLERLLADAARLAPAD